MSAKIAQILAPAHYMSIKGCVFRYCKNFREKVMVISLIRQATYSRLLPRKLQCGERYMNCTCSEKLCYVSSGKTGKEKLVSHHGFWFGSLLCSKLPTSLFLLFFLILFTLMCLCLFWKSHFLPLHKIVEEGICSICIINQRLLIIYMANINNW